MTPVVSSKARMGADSGRQGPLIPSEIPKQPFRGGGSNADFFFQKNVDLGQWLSQGVVSDQQHQLRAC